MPELLYDAEDQTAVVTGAPNTGVDVVPGNVIKCIFVELAGFDIALADITKLDKWQAFLAKDTITHAVTPFIDAFDLPPTTPISEGGNDSSTYNGVPRTRAISFATAKGKFSGADSTQIKQLRKLASKSGNFQQGTRIGVFMLHEGHGMTGHANAKPIPAYNIFISDAKKGGLGGSNDYDFEFHLEGGWSADEEIYQLAFKGATLENPA